MNQEERTERIAVRMTPTESTMLRELAESDGLSVSDFIRLLVRRMHKQTFSESSSKKGRK